VDRATQLWSGGHTFDGAPDALESECPDGSIVTNVHADVPNYATMVVEEDAVAG
jgi:hypothetical protein